MIYWVSYMGEDRVWYSVRPDGEDGIEAMPVAEGEYDLSEEDTAVCMARLLERMGPGQAMTLFAMK